MNEHDKQLELEHRFKDLCAEVLRQYDDRSGETICEPIDTEPHLIDLLHLIESHPDHRDVFVSLFLQVAHWFIPSPWFLLGFCMIRLRYPEVYRSLFDEFEDGMKRESFGRRFNYLKLNLDIFHDRDTLFVQMWPYYNKSSGSIRNNDYSAQ